MATTFDEVLLDVRYSAIAEGGPEFSTAIVRSGDGGSIASRAETREDYQSKYDIQYAELDNDRRKDLRSFAILRKGMARGFRFLAPDDHELEDENVGWYNTDDGEIHRMPDFEGPPPPDPADVPNPGLRDVYLIKFYSDVENSYIRRIVKPSPYEDVVITLVDGETHTATINAGAAIDPDTGEILASVTGTIGSSGGSIGFTFYFHEGRIHFAGDLPNPGTVRIDCTYHLPVAFTDDWQKFSVDETAISEFKPGVEEVLPIELGIAP